MVWGGERTWDTKGGNKTTKEMAFNHTPPLFLTNPITHGSEARTGGKTVPDAVLQEQRWSTQRLRICIMHCNVAPTTKAATSVLKCKRKPTRQSLSLESCQRLRHLPSTELLLCSPLQAFIFSVSSLFFSFFFFFFCPHPPSLKWCLCVWAGASLRQ